MLFLRSLAFFVGVLLFTPFFGVAVFAARVFGFVASYRMAQAWGRWVLGWVDICCGIRHEVQGWEHVPSHPVVVMSKHQSAWETLFLLTRMPPAGWIIKKELLWLPIVGWCLYILKAIPIDRSSGRQARDQIVDHGRERLKDGIWVVIFPEGTRVAPGRKKRYGAGGSLLAVAAGAEVLPVALNAGEVWGRYAFVKKPGTIQVHFGPRIPSKGKTAEELNAEVEVWIEGEMARISPKLYAGDDAAF
jgi:1-acyl-sn-glycerol-3-phosphate acyltransferase